MRSRREYVDYLRDVLKPEETLHYKSNYATPPPLPGSPRLEVPGTLPPGSSLAGYATPNCSRRARIWFRWLVS